MKAELHNKISSTGSNLNDRLEDQLTGDVFGTLTYLPFEEGLLKILLRTQEIKDISIYLDNMNWQNTKIIFWKKFDDGEPDVLLVSEKTVILIEIKYKSGLSSDDGADFSEEDFDTKKEWANDTHYSSHQLSRESLILMKNYPEKTNKLIIFVADEITCSYVYPDTVKRKIINPYVYFGYLSWQNVLETLIDNYVENSYLYRNAISDIINLLTKKGFERFKSFDNPIAVECDSVWRFNNKRKEKFKFIAKFDINKEYYYEY